MTKRELNNISPPQSSLEAEEALRWLLNIMASLRNPDGGCEWDIQQTHETIAPYTIEEAYEVAEAILNGNIEDFRDELGDLLLQVVFQARIAEEAGNFDFADIADSISKKMIRRHPHIFENTEQRSASQQRKAWEDLKAEERKSKNQNGILDDVATTLPSMIRAFKLQKRAARVGFDWENPEDVVGKVKEELNEVIEEMENDKTSNNDHLEGEIGDLLFAVINLARKTNIDPEQALSATNRKFVQRFNYIEKQAKNENQDLEQISIEQMEIWWNDAKSKS